MKKIVTVAVCGVQSRIGTTTQALQMVEYLQMMGFSAAYVEIAKQGYIDQMRKLYSDITVRDDCVWYDRIPLYQGIVGNHDAEEYDFLVKDYGAVNQPSFNQVSYLEQDIQIICGGVKPNEIFEVNDILKKNEYGSAKFIFSFVPADQKEDILALMTNRAQDTFFANYNPDPFSYDPTMNRTYRILFDTYLTGASGKLEKKTFQEKMKSVWIAVSYRIQTLKRVRWIRMLGFLLYTALIISAAYLWFH